MSSQKSTSDTENWSFRNGTSRNNKTGAVTKTTDWTKVAGGVSELANGLAKGISPNSIVIDGLKDFDHWGSDQTENGSANNQPKKGPKKKDLTPPVTT